MVCTHIHTHMRHNHKTKMFQYFSIFTLFYVMLLLKRNITSHHKWWCEYGDYFIRSKQTWRECFFSVPFYGVRVLNSFLEFIFSNDIYSSKVARLCVCIARIYNTHYTYTSICYTCYTRCVVYVWATQSCSYPKFINSNSLRPVLHM